MEKYHDVKILTKDGPLYQYKAVLGEIEEFDLIFSPKGFSPPPTENGLILVDFSQYSEAALRLLFDKLYHLTVFGKSKILSRSEMEKALLTEDDIIDYLRLYNRFQKEDLDLEIFSFYTRITDTILEVLEGPVLEMIIVEAEKLISDMNNVEKCIPFLSLILKETVGTIYPVSLILKIKEKFSRRKCGEIFGPGWSMMMLEATGIYEGQDEKLFVPMLKAGKKILFKAGNKEMRTFCLKDLEDIGVDQFIRLGLPLANILNTGQWGGRYNKEVVTLFYLDYNKKSYEKISRGSKEVYVYTAQIITMLYYLLHGCSREKVLRFGRSSYQETIENDEERRMVLALIDYANGDDDKVPDHPAGYKDFIAKIYTILVEYLSRYPMVSPAVSRKK